MSDTLYITEHPDGVALSPNDPVFKLQLDAARNITKKRRAVLRKWLKEKMDLD